MFTFTGLVATDDAALGVTAEAHAVQVLHPVVVRETATAPLVVQLEPERVLAGQVIDAQGRPVEVAHVVLQGDRFVSLGTGIEPRTWEAWLGAGGNYLGGVLTDAEGRFAFGRLYDGTFALTAEHHERKGLRVRRVERSGRDDVVLVLDDAALEDLGTLTGSVRDALTGAPIVSFSVFLSQVPAVSGPVENYGAYENADGAFVVEGIEPGTYQPSCRADGFALWVGVQGEIVAGVQSVDIARLPERTMHLRVVDQFRVPVPFVYVHFEDDAGERINLKSQAVADGFIGGTGRDGEVVVHSLPATRVALVLRKDRVPGMEEWRLQRRILFDLRAPLEGVTEISIVLPVDRMLSLMLFDPSPGLPPGSYSESDTVVRNLSEQGEQAFTLLSRPVQVTIRDAEGQVVAEGSCTPHADGEEPGFSVESNLIHPLVRVQAPVVSLLVPLGALRIELSTGAPTSTFLDVAEGRDKVERIVVLPHPEPDG